MARKKAGGVVKDAVDTDTVVPKNSVEESVSETKTWTVKKSCLGDSLTMKRLMDDTAINVCSQCHRHNLIAQHGLSFSGDARR